MPKLRLVHSAVDTDQYRPDRSHLGWFRQEFKLPETALVIGMVAQFINRKGHQTLLDALPAGHRLRLPMREGCRSLNLSNTVAVAVYEGWRQLGFK